MRCTKTNIMCYGGHITFEDFRVYIRNVENNVVEITNAQYIKQFKKDIRVKVVAVPKRMNLKINNTNFDHVNDLDVKIRYTSSTKAMGQNHLDVVEHKEEDVQRKINSVKIVNDFSMDNESIDLKNSTAQKILKAFTEVGSIELIERIDKAKSSGEISSLTSLNRFIANQRSMSDELGVVRGYSKEISASLILGVAPNKKPKVPLFSSHDLVEDHAVLRYFERVVPRLEKVHVEIAREVYKKNSKSEIEKTMKDLKSELRRSGITEESINEAKIFISRLITDKIGSDLNRNDRFVFSSRVTSSSNDNRFILNVDLGFNEKIDIVCELLRKKPGSDSYIVKIVSLWSSVKTGNYTYDNSHNYNQINEDSIWYLEGIDKNTQYDLARATEKVIMKAFK